MPAPSLAAIVVSPAPLNPQRLFPFIVDPLPADVLFGAFGADLAPRQEPTDLPANPDRREVR